MSAAAVIERLNDELVVPEREWTDFLSSLGWDMEQVMRGEYPEGADSLADLQLACISQDHYLWCQFFLEEPTSPEPWGSKGPWNFFDYQIPAIRWNGSLMMYCASKVGKTRNFIAKALALGCNTPGGSGGFGAPEDDQLKSIYKGIMDQLEGSPMLKGMLKKGKEQPHMDIELTDGFHIWLRTAKSDGKTFRSKHPVTFGFLDEAAKLHKKIQWSEFIRALGPHCILGLGSVPDGRRDTPFYMYGRIAKAQASKKKADALANKEQTPDDDLVKDLVGRYLRLFHWEVKDMPGEYSSPERMAQLEQDYGGKDQPGYIHNVLGEDGDPEATVFPWPLFSRLIKEIPEYVCIKLLVDESSAQANLHVYRVQGERTVTIRKDSIPLNDFNIRDIVNRYFSADPAIAMYFMGGDLGYSNDEAEFGATAVIGDINRDVARISMKGVKYPLMREAWDAMDDIFDKGQSMKSGVDVGGAGTAFYQELVSACPDKHYPERCVPVDFGGKADVLAEGGSPIMKEGTDKPLRRRVKSLSTEILVKRMQGKLDELPHDPDYVRSFPGHTSWAGPDGDTKYLGTDDHIIDRRRAGAWAFHREGQEYPDIEGCGSGVPLGGGSSGGAFLT